MALMEKKTDVHNGWPERHEEEPVTETVVSVIFSDLKQFVADVLSDTLRLMFGSYL